MPDPPESKSADKETLAVRKHWFSMEHSMNIIGATQIGLFIAVAGFLLHQMKPVLLPLVLAVIVSMVLHPIYMIFRRMRLPRMIAAFVTLVGLIGVLGFGVYHAVVPGSKYAGTIDRDEISSRLQEVFRPVGEVRAEIKEVTDQLEQAQQVEEKELEKEAAEDDAEDNADEDGEGDSASPGENEEEPRDLLDGGEAAFEVDTAVINTQEVTYAGDDGSAPGADDEDRPSAEETVEKKEPVVVEVREDPVGTIIEEARALGLSVFAFLLLVLFILAYGNRVVRCLSEEESTALLLQRMGKDVSHYLLTITLINAGLGLCVGLAMWLLGMPNPSLWGLMAFVFNYIPYVGAFTGTVIVFLAAVVEFRGAGTVLLIPSVYFLCTAIEGNFVTPMVLGGRFRLNPLIVFVWIFAWAGFWGVAGMLIAMPALVIFKIACENTETLEKFRRVLAS